MAADASAAAAPSLRLDRRVRKEARLLAKEARSGLKRHRERLKESIASELSARVARLEKALEAGDREAMRTELVVLDALVDEHLSFARKSTVREYAESIAIAVMIALFLRAFVVEAFKIPSGSMIPTMEIGDHIFVNKFLYGVRIPYTNTKFFEWRKPERGEVIVFINPCTPNRDFIKRITAIAGDTVEMRCDVLYVNGVATPSRLVAEDDCRYWDYTDSSNRWSSQTCSRYVESFAGKDVTTQYDPERPRKDRERAITGSNGSYWMQDGNHDFPNLAKSDDDAVPACPGSTVPNAAQRARARGRLEQSPKVPGAGPCAPQLHYVVPEGHVFVMGDNRDNSDDSRAWGPVPLENIKGKAMFIWYSSKPAAQGGIQWRRIGQLVH
jgi:signal peptidase I